MNVFRLSFNPLLLALLLIYECNTICIGNSLKLKQKAAAPLLTKDGNQHRVYHLLPSASREEEWIVLYARVETKPRTKLTLKPAEYGRGIAITIPTRCT